MIDDVEIKKEIQHAIQVTKEEAYDTLDSDMYPGVDYTLYILQRLLFNNIEIK